MDKELKAFLEELTNISNKYNMHISSEWEGNPNIVNNAGDILFSDLSFNDGKYTGDKYIEPIIYIPEDKKGYCSYCKFFRKATKYCGNPLSMYYYNIFPNRDIILNGQSNSCDKYKERKDKIK